MDIIANKKQPFTILLFEVFFVTFSIHVKGFSRPFTLRNLAIGMILCVYFIFYHRNLLKRIESGEYRRFFYSWVLIVIYSILLLFMMNVDRSDSHNIFRSTFNFFIMVVILPEFFCRVEKSFDRYAKAIIFGTTIQAIIVILSFLFPQVKTFLYNIQSFDDNWLAYRTIGLGIAGAGGTVYLFCGFMIIAYWILFKEHSFLMYLLQFIVLFAIILVGRTGFYLSLATIGIMLVINTIRHDNRLIKNLGKLVVALGFAIAIISFLGGQIDINTSLLESSFRRLSELWTTNRTLQTIQKMEVPKLSFINFILGTGLTKGYGFDRIRIWNDSGYIQRYFALGLVPAIFSYYCLIRYCISLIRRIADRNQRGFWYCMLILLYIVEYKEAFIFYLALPFTIIVSLKLINKKGGGRFEK